jgi:hypothetical protein
MLRLLLIAAWVCLFTGVMAYEWSRWPNGSTLFGPFWIIRYNGLHFESGAACLVLFAMLSAFPVKPHLLTFLLVLPGLVGWLGLGLVGQGIGC